MNTKIIYLIRTIILCFLISFLLISLAAIILWKTNLSASQMQPGIYAIYAISCLFGGFFAGRKLQEKRVLWGVILGLIYFLFLIILSALLLHTVPVLSAKALITLTLCILGGIIGAVIS